MPKWTCHLCNVTFSLKKNLTAHEKTSRSHFAKQSLQVPHHDSLVCSVCAIGFSKKSGLKRHLEVQHGIHLEEHLKDVKKTKTPFDEGDVSNVLSPNPPQS